MFFTISNLMEKWNKDFSFYRYSRFAASLDQFEQSSINNENLKALTQRAKEDLKKDVLDNKIGHLQITRQIAQHEFDLFKLSSDQATYISSCLLFCKSLAQFFTKSIRSERDYQQLMLYPSDDFCLFRTELAKKIGLTVGDPRLLKNIPNDISEEIKKHLNTEEHKSLFNVSKSIRKNHFSTISHIDISTDTDDIFIRRSKINIIERLLANNPAIFEAVTDITLSLDDGAPHEMMMSNRIDFPRYVELLKKFPNLKKLSIKCDYKGSNGSIQAEQLNMLSELKSLKQIDLSELELYARKQENGNYALLLDEELKDKIIGFNAHLLGSIDRYNLSDLIRSWHSNFKNLSLLGLNVGQFAIMEQFPTQEVIELIGSTGSIKLRSDLDILSSIPEDIKPYITHYFDTSRGPSHWDVESLTHNLAEQQNISVNVSIYYRALEYIAQGEVAQERPDRIRNFCLACLAAAEADPAEQENLELARNCYYLKPLVEAQLPNLKEICCTKRAYKRIPETIRNTSWSQVKWRFI